MTPDRDERTRNRSPSRDRERIAFARNQRKQANEFAQDVWQIVRGSRMLGLKFRREHPIGRYTVDFVCLSIKLIIEVDGKEHFTEEGKNRDQGRDDYLRAEGFEILRIPGYRVTQNRHSVNKLIEHTVRVRQRSLS